MLFDFFGRRNCGCGCGDALVPTPYDTAVPSPLIPAAVTPDCACGNGGSTCGNGCACNIPCRCVCPPDMPPAALKKNLALINARPKKVLHYHTPQDLFLENLSNCCT